MTGKTKIPAAYILTWKDLQIHVTRKNIKNLYLRIREPGGQPEISAPLFYTDSQILEFVRSREDWIRQAQQKLAARRQERQEQPEVVEAPFMEREKRQKLSRLIRELIARYEPVMGVKSAGFTIKKMKTRWGSCNPRTGHLNFNYDLAEKSYEEIEYVVVHELTHLLEPSHNQRFWALMEHYLPGAKLRRKKLNGK